MKNRLNPIAFLSLLIISSIASIAHAGVGPKSIQPILIGSEAPETIVRDIEGNEIALNEIFEKQATIVVFYRGGWCPYCNTHLRELIDVEPQLVDMGYQIVAISPDSPSKLKETADKHDLHYTMYSDSSLESAAAFGIAYTLDPKTLARYQSKNRLTGYSDGINEDQLPVPSVFIVTEDKEISFQYADPDHRSRIPAELLLAAAKASIDFHEE